MRQIRSTRHVERQKWWRGPARIEGDSIAAYTPPDQISGEIRVGEARGYSVASVEWMEYDLYLEPDVPLELASVTDAAAAAEFVTGYGFLHKRAENSRGRERIADILDSARQIAGLLELHGLLQAVAGGDPKSMGGLRKWTKRIASALSRDSQRFPPPPWVQNKTNPTDTDLVGSAGIALSWLLNDGLRLGDVRVNVAAARTLGRESFTADELDFVSLAKDLSGFIYYQLAEMMVARTPVGRCEGCPRFFEITDPRKRFHDDRCRARHQMRRLRAKEKAHGKAR